jgi:iron complex transport system ATP-binding protein
MNTQLELCQLTVTIAGKTVCNGLDLTMEGGQCWGLLGVNGVGKTTLLHTLAGLKPAQAGEVLVNGEPRSAYSPRALAQLCGILFQDYRDTFPCTVLEAALIGRHPYLRQWQWESAQDREIAVRALERVGLQGLEQRDITTLSGGERRRLDIAILLTQAPQILLLDEPANHLDLHHQISLLDQLSQDCRQQHKLMVMVVHDVNLAARYCDHVLLLCGDGEYRAGASEELLNAEVLSNLYQHPMILHQATNGRYFFPQ